MIPISQKDYSVRDMTREQARVEYRQLITKIDADPTRQASRRDAAKLRALMLRAGVNPEFALLLRVGK